MKKRIKQLSLFSFDVHSIDTSEYLIMCTIYKIYKCKEVMFLVNIKDIWFLWTINHVILSIPDIENLSLYNINKDTFVYMK